MPVGFENSALKMSFSLSSLQSGGAQESPQQAMLKVERPYNSLTKKTKGNLERDMWNQSWSTQEEKKDDFWAALQPNYNYLMDNNLIESCKEAHGELNCEEEEKALFLKWSFQDFTTQFSELRTWLNEICGAIYDKEENIRNMDLRLKYVEAMRRNSYKRKIFTEQAKKLLMDHSELVDDVSWRVEYLNSKWDMLEHAISPSKGKSQKSFHADLEHEVECLKDWIEEMERRLTPLKIHSVSEWNIQELLEKSNEGEVLHNDIKEHEKVVVSVLKRAEYAGSTSIVHQAEHLQKRWQHLYIGTLEWQLVLENALKNCKHPYSEYRYSESDEEPVSKHPRFSSADCSDHLTDDASYFEDDIQVYCKDGNVPPDLRTSSLKHFSSHDHKMEMDGCDGADNVSYQRPDHDSTNIKQHLEEKSETTNPGPSTFSSNAEIQTTGSTSFANDAISFNQSDRKARNLGTFYFQHRDSDADKINPRGNARKELVTSNYKMCEVKMYEDSSDEEWTYTSANRVELEKERGLSVNNFHLTSNKRNVAVRLDFGENDENLQNNGAQGISQCLDISSCDGENSSCNEALSSTEDTKESIQWLVSQAEVLVREGPLMSLGETQNLSGHDSPTTKSQMSSARIKQWLTVHPALQEKCQVPDSCDASGEYTTGDSEDECSVESREEGNGMTLVNKQLDALRSTQSQLDSSEGFNDLDDTMKAENSSNSLDQKEPLRVVLRSKQLNKRERPWSVPGFSQLSTLARKIEESGFANFSTSESALHEMFPPNAMRDRQNSMVSSNSFQDNLSSSTVNETVKLASEHSGSLPRRRKHRKKTSLSMCVKSDTTCEAVNQFVSSTDKLPPKCKISKSTPKSLTMKTEDKACTNSETTCSSAASEQNNFSDSSVFATETSSNKINPEEKTLGFEEELPSGKSLRFPVVFRLGPKEGAVTPKLDLTTKVLSQSGDSDVERTSGVQGTDEQLSSSDQAWDNYQEKYMSEPYSEEMVDSEIAKGLLEFGDDYYKFLESQSDCASSLEMNQRLAPQRKKKSVVPTGDSSVLDSDSDWEDIHHVINQSQSHFDFAEMVLNKRPAGEMGITDYEEIIATCKENKRCLKVILENVKEGEILTPKERREIQELLEKWNDLQVRADEIQKMSGLQQNLVQMRKKLLGTTSRISSLADNLNDLSQLESAIKVLKEESSSLLDFKDQLLHLSNAIDYLETDSTSQSSTLSSILPQLKEDVTDLYRIWGDSFKSVTSRLEQFENAVETCLKFDKELANLKISLQGDHSVLLLLHKSLDDGVAPVEDVAVSVRDIARLLSEVPEGVPKRDVNLISSSCQELREVSIATREGSLTDSGISDSGSENEVSERARRIAYLRQLANHLQEELGTSDGLVLQINEQIEHLDRELHELQDVCQKLIVRTSKCSEPGATQHELISTKRPQVLEKFSPKPSKLSAKDKESTKCSKPHRRRSAGSKPELRRTANAGKASKDDKGGDWMWRIARASLPVQLTLVTLICVACFLEPHCCENVNNLNFVLSPQLRYLYGPPPV